MSEVNLLDFDLDGLAAFCDGLGEKRFRAQQLFRWVHQRGESDFARMSDLALSLRDKLAGVATVTAPALLSEQASADGTIKWLFDMGGGDAVETVFIPEDDRGTLCISSQAGCAVGCRFCSTGHQGFSRNLSTAEIVGQLWFAERRLRERLSLLLTETAQPMQGSRVVSNVVMMGMGEPLQNYARRVMTTLLTTREPCIGCAVVSNVVMMGMGEPLQNYAALLPALRVMLDDHAYGLSRRRVTVSTSGVVPMIDRLREDCPVALAVSLHAPNDALRSQLVPLNRKYPLAELLQACTRYLDTAPRDFITLEYCMLQEVNDTPDLALQLVRLVRGLEGDAPALRCKLNLIPFNPFPESGLHRSTPQRVNEFAHVLREAGVVTTVRKTRGDDIAAACGQLAGEVRDRTQVQQRMRREPIRILAAQPEMGSGAR